LLCPPAWTRHGDGFADALVSAAAADVAAHEIVDVASVGLGFFESKATADMICPD